MLGVGEAGALSPRLRSPWKQQVALGKSLPHLISVPPTHGEALTAHELDVPATLRPQPDTQDTLRVLSKLCHQGRPPPSSPTSSLWTLTPFLIPNRAKEAE